MKKTFTLEKDGVSITTKEIETATLELLKVMGFKKKDIENIDFYYNANEGKTYFVANKLDGETIEGQI